MFTRISKGLLWVVVVFVALLALLALLFIGLFGFLIVLLGGGAMLLSFGIYIEIANNILDIKESLSMICKNDIDESNIF